MHSIKINISSNPWLPEYKSFFYEEEKYINLVEKIKDTCEKKRGIYKSSLQYDRIVNNMLLSNYSSSKYSDYAYGVYIRVVLDILERKCNKNDWNCGYNTARRIVETRAAWSSPGFYDAYKNVSIV